jgi:hypothetical protein
MRYIPFEVLTPHGAMFGVILPISSAHKSLPNLPYVLISLDNVLVLRHPKVGPYANNSPIKISNTLISKSWIPLLPLGAIDISCGTATPLDVN